LLVAVVALRMHAPHILLLWLLCALSSLMIATGTLALLATFGSIGQLLAMLLLVYLSLASFGGTVPIQALPGVFIYFEARGDAGLTHSLVIVACELAFWGILGLAVTSWYDRRKLDRIAPDLLRYVERAVDRRVTDTREPASVPGRRPA
jgi:hypothetical protein